ncbi:AVAST type 2 anti-phage system protein Avs2 [Olivibacter domesticus]|uniref:Trypsin n=1 Tax=Olivibacter domesticus TaxID=407022 RepID=A0A1H7IIX7_OLID1|nr:AVAST type 2 anti-phage system protein Avs2 [Olivibacter domesticus]SEK62429.1 Trypsin [Olivibacter domesticus]
MEHKNDILISQLTVRLFDIQSEEACGTGVIYKPLNNKYSIYIFTAAHCLFREPETLSEPITKIGIELFQSNTNSYIRIEHSINHSLVSTDVDKDVAILILNRDEIEKQLSTIPIVRVTNTRQSATQFIVKGFPLATQGKELDSISPTWSQEMTGVRKFQLKLDADYADWATKGFSGSGIFLHTKTNIYLFGIFARIRVEGAGKIIYCQYMDTINELLEINYLPPISFSYLADHGLSPDFFTKHIDLKIADLGPRFNPDLNFSLPIVQEFHTITRDSQFRTKTTKVIDTFLSARIDLSSKEDNVILKAEQDYIDFQKWVEEWYTLLKWEPECKINIKQLNDKLDSLNTELDTIRLEVYKKQGERLREIKEKGEEYDKYHPPFSAALSRLNDLFKNCDTFYTGLNRIDFDLTNKPIFIIKGEAGSGKSHLLGDIATRWQHDGKPVILLLGQQFKKEQSLWNNILSQLDLHCTKNEFLESLENIGKQLSMRVPMLIDALNEGGGADVWYHQLAGFVKEISQYPYIALVLTVRSTYYSAIIPEQIRSDQSIKKWTHQGFKGNEYAALRLFCEHFGLQQPNFPILAPEFTNPLFLQLVCAGVKESGQKAFPKGFLGFSSIFAHYLKAITAKIIPRRPEYKYRTNFVSDAIYKVAEKIFLQPENRYLPFSEANDLFDQEFPKLPHLLADLIEESVFIQNMFRDYKSQEEYDGLFFAYERIGDYYMANELLKPFKNIEDVIQACQEKQVIGRLAMESYWRNNGILEALAVLLPEQHNLEIFEAFNWLFSNKKRRETHLDANTLNSILLASFKWRRPESIEKEKVVKWLTGPFFFFEYHQVFNTFLGISTYPGNPFNGDYLHGLLWNYPLGERDALWLQHLYYYTGLDDNGDPMPIERLIDWAWQEKISYEVDQETARLAGQTLAWVLASSDRNLRDRTTKAMVCLLQEQPQALISILKAFDKIDDLYIAERLMAVAMGCALRTTKKSSLSIIANYVYDEIFNKQNPPEHILLRDYARNIVEYAAYRKSGDSFDLRKVRPPYNSKMPNKFPTETQIKKFHKADPVKGTEKGYQREFNQIHFSVLSWDFGRYIVDAAVGHFAPTSFVIENEIKAFIKKLSPSLRKTIKDWERLTELEKSLKETPTNHLTTTGKKIKAAIKIYLKTNNSALKEGLNEEQFKYFKETVIPNVKAKNTGTTANLRSYPSGPIKRWIVRRAHELGYKADLHGSYDRQIDSRRQSRSFKLERIGKKYQWIAFHEIMAKLTDNFKFGDGYGQDKEYNFYQGPWEMYLRDIDPVFITKNPEESENEEIISSPQLPNEWWLDVNYRNWEEDDLTWCRNANDLPDPGKIIQCMDHAGNEWLYLRLNVNWKPLKSVGQDKYKSRKKEIWYLIQGYLVTQKDKKRISSWLSKKSFKGRNIPESRSQVSLFNRELYWSPISIAYKKESRLWIAWDDNAPAKNKVMVATDQALGEISEDSSGAHFYYDIPCSTLFEGMHLQYGQRDGELIDKNGKTIVSNINPQGTLIRKNELLDFLDKNDLDIVWIILGEKQVFNASFSRHGNYFGTISGTYTYENGGVEGTFKLLEDE